MCSDYTNIENRCSHVLLLSSDNAYYICNRNDDTIHDLPGLSHCISRAMDWMGIKSWGNVFDVSKMESYSDEWMNIKILNPNLPYPNYNCQDQAILNDYKDARIEEYMAQEMEKDKVCLNRFTSKMKRYHADIESKVDKFFEKCKNRWEELYQQGLSVDNPTQIYWFWVLKKFYYDQKYKQLIKDDWEKYEALKRKEICFDEYVVLMVFKDILRMNKENMENNPLTRYQFISYVLKRNKIEIKFNKRGRRK